MSLTPVTVLTGFFGSGKTTLLQAMLRNPDFADSAVLVNAFGAVGIDHALVRETSGNVVLLAGGCVCCQVAGELVQGLRDLHFRRAAGEIPPFRRAIVETTGLADPAPLLRTLAELPLVAARYALAGVVTTVDATDGGQALDNYEAAVKQVAVADRMVLTKTDLAGARDIDALAARLRALNPRASIVRASHGAVDPAHLLATGLHLAIAEPSRIDAWFGKGWRSHAAAGSSPGGHDAKIRSYAWTAPAPLAAGVLDAALAALLAAHGEGILRLKGLVHVAGEPGPRAVHAVHHRLDAQARLAHWPPGPEFAARESRLVFVTRGLEDAAIAQTLERFFPRTPCNPPPKKTSSPSPS